MKNKIDIETKILLENMKTTCLKNLLKTDCDKRIFGFYEKMKGQIDLILEKDKEND